MDGLAENAGKSIIRQAHCLSSFRHFLISHLVKTVS